MDRRTQEAGRSNDPGDIEQQAQHLAELMRSGEIEKNKVEFAAFLGYEPAKLVIPEEDVQSPFSEFPIDDEGQARFFAYIEQSFTKNAVLSMFREVIDHFKALATLQPYGIDLNSGGLIDEVIEAIDLHVSGKTVSNEKLTELSLRLTTEYNRYTDNFNNDLDVYLVDIDYITAYFQTLINIFNDLIANDDSLGRAHLDLVVVYCENTQPPSSIVMNNLPDQLRKTINSMQSKSVVSSMDDLAHTQLVHEVFLSMMKKGGLKWALKDVK